MNGTFRTAWLSDIVDILDDPKTKSIICHGKQFDLVKHGHWIEDEERIKDQCSVCGLSVNWSQYKTPYCAFCGAKMDGERKQDDKTN